MKIEEIRLLNARQLARKFNKLSDFAAAIRREPTQVSRFMGKNPSKNIGSQMARHIEKMFELQEGWLDLPHNLPSHEIKKIVLKEYASTYEESKIIAIPQYRNHSLSAGPGSIAEDEKPGSEMYFKNSWLKHKGWKEKELFVIYVKGTSMEPVLSDGDVVLINSSDKLITSGQIYAINTYGETKIKRIFRQINGSLLIKSENIDFPEETMPASDVENLIILGRAVWVGKELF